MIWNSPKALGAALIVALIVLLMMSCAENTAGNSFCQIAQPILISEQDVLTTETARQILAHDEIGDELCGWLDKVEYE